MAPASRTSRAAPALLLVAGAFLAACEGGPASPGAENRTSIALAARFSDAVSGKDGAAYDAADNVWIRLTAQSSAPGSILFEDVQPFDPAGPETRLRVEVELEVRTDLLVELEIRRGQDPLFRGSAELTVVPGGQAQANIQLRAVPAGILIPASLGPLHSLGETVELGGAVIFATGDTTADLSVEWTSLDPDVAAVTMSGGPPRAVAVADGEARFRGSHASFAETLTIVVEIRVASVGVEPASNEIFVGEAVQLTASARDALNNVLSGRETNWSSSDPLVAAVDQEGLVRGRAPGSVEIVATVEAAMGMADVRILAIPPTIRTAEAVDVGPMEARLRAVVNPNGVATMGWFEWDVGPSLSDPNTTPVVALGSDVVDQTFDAVLTDLSPGTQYYFRAVASNTAGTERSEILGFVTQELDPPSVVTLPATDVGTNGATLEGSVNPNGAPTTAWFAWGTNPSLEGQTTPPVSVGSGSEAVSVHADLGDLAPERTHYFRVVANSDFGTSQGEIFTFRTAIPAPSNLEEETPRYIFWQDNSQTEAFFLVELSTASATSGFEGIGTVGQNATFFEYTGPLPTGTVYYRVLACTVEECSEPSGVLVVDVPSPTISGRVDTCSDACYDPEIEVSLTGPTARSTLTDDFGFFRFDSIPVGTYLVSVRGDYCPDFYIDFSPESRVVTVSGGEFADVDFLGTSTSCLAAFEVAVEVNGAPADEVTIELSGPESRGPVTTRAATTTFSGLPLGDYTITVSGLGLTAFCANTTITDTGIERFFSRPSTLDDPGSLVFVLFECSG